MNAEFAVLFCYNYSFCDPLVFGQFYNTWYSSFYLWCEPMFIDSLRMRRFSSLGSILNHQNLTISKASRRQMASILYMVFRSSECLEITLSVQAFTELTAHHYFSYRIEVVSFCQVQVKCSLKSPPVERAA